MCEVILIIKIIIIARNEEEEDGGKCYMSDRAADQLVLYLAFKEVIF